jgi:LSD1 subclass zinc finger protein
LSADSPSPSDIRTAQSADQLRFPCKQCGGTLQFEPGTTSLKCPYCSTINEIDTSDAVVLELDYGEYMRKLQSAAPVDTVLSVKCTSCSADIDPPKNITSFACPFCGSNIVAKARECSVIKPNAVLPFKMTRDQATTSFRQWIQSRWFAPNALKRQALLDAALHGIYLPAWTYDSFVTTRYSGQRGEAYYVTVGSGKNRRTERRVRWYPASGVVQNNFDDVLVLASESLPREKVEDLTPWDLKDVEPYKEAFLAGFTAERYQLSLPDGFQQAHQLMQPTIDATIRQDIGGDEQRITGKQSKYDNITFKHVLLPIWCSAYRYRGKVYRFLVNARTGEVQGERPWSPWKIAFAIVLGLLVIIPIIWFIVVNRQ